MFYYFYVVMTADLFIYKKILIYKTYMMCILKAPMYYSEYKCTIFKFEE